MGPRLSRICDSQSAGLVSSSILMHQFSASSDFMVSSVYLFEVVTFTIRLLLAGARPRVDFWMR